MIINKFVSYRLLRWGSAFWMGLASMLPLSVQAEDDPPNSWYIGAGAGLSNMEVDTGETDYQIADDEDGSFRLFIGYDYNRRFSVEAVLSNLGSVELDGSANPGLENEAEIDFLMSSVNLLWYFWQDNDDLNYPYRRGWQAYAEGGISLMSNPSDVRYDPGNVIDPTIGAGLEYGWENGLSARLGVDYFSNDGSQVYLGLIKRFGRTAKPAVVVEQAKPEPAILPVAVPAPKPIPIPVPKPKVDDDRDGVYNRHDTCPGTRANISVDDSGCSIFQAPLDGVYFEPSSANLSDAAKKILDRVIVELLEFADVHIEVQAHTDNRGDALDNFKLSEKRAFAVYRYMIKQGVAPERLTKKGYGESEPVANNYFKTGRAKNRRVELVVIN